MSKKRFANSLGLIAAALEEFTPKPEKESETGEPPFKYCRRCRMYVPHPCEPSEK